MSLNLESVKCINQNIKDVVTGYIHNIQSLFPYEENPYYIIPELIQMIILLFCDKAEYFTIAGDDIDLDDSNPNIISYDANKYESDSEDEGCTIRKC